MTQNSLITKTEILEMDHIPEKDENHRILPFPNKLEVTSATENASKESQAEFPSVLKNSYSNLLTIEDEYEGLSVAEATTDVTQCNERVLDKENELSDLSSKLSQEKSKLEMLKGDLEEAEFCLSMARSYEAAITGWRETIESLESLHNATIKAQSPFSMAEEAWKDLKLAEQQAQIELENASSKEVIHAPYGSMSAQKTGTLLPDEISIEILGDYLPVSILTERAQLALAHCRQGNATYAVHCQ